MAKFCGKCGSKLDELTGLCPKGCNAPMNRFNNNQNGTNQNPSQQNLNRNPNRSAAFPPVRPQNPPIENRNPVPPRNTSNGNTPVRPVQKKKKKGWLIALIVVLALIAVSACVVALSYFDVVEIPFVSEYVDKLLKPGDDENDSTSTDAAPVLQLPSPVTTTAAATTVPTTVPAADFTVSGVVSSEEWEVNKQQRTSYILQLDTAMEFKPYAPYDAIYGETVKTDRVELFGDDIARFLNKHVTVHGELSYASENYQKETVLINKCQFEITPDDAKYNQEHEETTAAVNGMRVTIRLNEDAGSGAVLNIRSGPGYDYDVVNTVLTGTTVTLLDEQNGWAYVDCGSFKGWCNITVAGFDTPGTKSRVILPFATVSCSSDQGSGENERKYTPDMAVDDNYNTCWMAAGGEGGSGNWIQFYFDTEKTVSGIEFLNGNCWDGMYKGTKVASNLYQINGRIKQFTLTFSDGSTKKYTAKDVYETDFGANIFFFDQPVKTSSIRLSVDTGYPGDKWTTVVCLSEFAAFQ